MHDMEDYEVSLTYSWKDLFVRLWRSIQGWNDGYYEDMGRWQLIITDLSRLNHIAAFWGAQGRRNQSIYPRAARSYQH
jgi:hypothetical protein